MDNPNETESNSARSSQHRVVTKALSLAITLLAGIAIGFFSVGRSGAQDNDNVGILAKKRSKFDAQITDNSARMMDEGKNTFRFDTFGDEAFWGDALKLNQAI